MAFVLSQQARRHPLIWLWTGPAAFALMTWPFASTDPLFWHMRGPMDVAVYGFAIATCLIGGPFSLGAMLTVWAAVGLVLS